MVRRGEKGGKEGKEKERRLLGGNMAGRMGKGMSGEETREKGGKEGKGREGMFGRNMTGRMGNGMSGEERGKRWERGKRKGGDVMGGNRI